MSAAVSTISAALSGTSYVALPAAGLMLASAGPVDSMPDPVRAAVWLLGGLAFLATLAANITKLVALARGLMGSAVPVSAAGQPEPFITRRELDDRLVRIENKIDRNNRDHRKELTSLTGTMNMCLRDMTEAIARLEGAVNAES